MCEYIRILCQFPANLFTAQNDLSLGTGFLKMHNGPCINPAPFYRDCSRSLWDFKIICGSIALPNSVSFLNVFSVLFICLLFFFKYCIVLKLLIKCQNSCQHLNNFTLGFYWIIFTMLYLFGQIYCLLFHYQHCLFGDISLLYRTLDVFSLHSTVCDYILQTQHYIFKPDFVLSINKSFVFHCITTATWEEGW